LKTQYELDEFDTTKEHVVKILVMRRCCRCW